jgi:hypothetical protein
MGGPDIATTSSATPNHCPVLVDAGAVGCSALASGAKQSQFNPILNHNLHLILFIIYCSADKFNGPAIGPC